MLVNVGAFSRIPATHTTPDSIRLNALLARMVAAGCTHACMEVSSHAVVQHRTTALRFVGGITSLPLDGLPSRPLLSPTPTKRGLVMLQNTAARREPIPCAARPHFGPSCWKTHCILGL